MVDQAAFKDTVFPAQIWRVCRKIADAGVNINLVYGSMMGVVIGADDLDKARAAVA